MIVGDTLYRRGIDTVLLLNDCHSGACGGHQYGYATAQNILRAGYFFPTMFKDCIIAVKICHAFPIFDCKTRLPPAPLHLVVVVGPFAKWGINFMTCNPPQAGGMVLLCIISNLILYSALWAYRTSVRNATRFIPFQLVYGLEAVLSIECEISSLKLTVDLLPKTSEEEARFLELIQLDETCRDAALANEAHKK
eukprot:PITA_22321